MIGVSVTNQNHSRVFKNSEINGRPNVTTEDSVLQGADPETFGAALIKTKQKKLSINNLVYSAYMEPLIQLAIV